MSTARIAARPRAATFIERVAPQSYYSRRKALAQEQAHPNQLGHTHILLHTCRLLSSKFYSS